MLSGLNQSELTDSRNAGYPEIPRSARVSIVVAFRYFGGIARTEVGDWRCQLADIWAANPSTARSTRKLPTALKPDIVSRRIALE